MHSFFSCWTLKFLYIFEKPIENFKNEINKESNWTFEYKIKAIIMEYFFHSLTLADDIGILNRKESENKIPGQIHFWRQITVWPFSLVSLYLHPRFSLKSCTIWLVRYGGIGVSFPRFNFFFNVSSHWSRISWKYIRYVENGVYFAHISKKFVHFVSVWII